MKNTFWLFVLCTLCGLFFQNCKDKCDDSVSVNAVQPNTNPVGYEVLLKTNGFSNPASAKVVFGTVEASTRVGGAPGEIIAKVPAGLSGNVEISVEEGDCIARSGGFVVSGALPSGTQPSLPNIVISVPLAGTPPGVGNLWINAATTFDVNGSPEQTILIVETPKVGDVINFDEDFSRESNKTVQNPISGFANLKTKHVEIVIDRTSNGGSIEHFDGQFIEVPSFLLTKAKYTILVASRETGRQLLIYYSL